MSTIELTEEEQALLIEILDSTVSDIKYEIADTDNSQFKEKLRSRKTALSRLLSKIRTEESARG